MPSRLKEKRKSYFFRSTAPTVEPLSESNIDMDIKRR